MYQKIGNAAYKADLENAYILDGYFGHPHSKFKTIHVAGTNGKGSVSHMLASVLQAAGYKTGLYTSPHLLDFRERIKINGIMISEQFVTEFTSQYLKLFEKIKPSFFEMTVFMAFDYFVKEKVDIAVIEVGLGGRLDTTNIILPEVSVITNISKDHTQLLGNTIPEIAHEKGGIIKKNIPVVIGETQKETRPVFDEIANKHNCKINYADQLYSIDDQLREITGSVVHHFSSCPYWNLSSITIDLKGFYQKKNLCTVLMTLAVLEQKGTQIGVSSVIKGLERVVKSTGLQGRWQEVSFNPLVVCDTAHNYNGIENVLGQIKNTSYQELHMVLGFVSDKDIRSIAGILPPEACYYLCAPNIPRAKNVDELKLIFEEFNLRNSIHSGVAEAYQAAARQANESDLIFVGGSNFVVADFLEWHKGNL